jgi:transposase InsO family protein
VVWSSPVDGELVVLSYVRRCERLSVGRTEVCWDDALAESFFATLKRELVPADGHV